MHVYPLVLPNRSFVLWFHLPCPGVGTFPPLRTCPPPRAPPGRVACRFRGRKETRDVPRSVDGASVGFVHIVVPFSRSFRRAQRSMSSLMSSPSVDASAPANARVSYHPVRQALEFQPPRTGGSREGARRGTANGRSNAKLMHKGSHASTVATLTFANASAPLSSSAGSSP